MNTTDIMEILKPIILAIVTVVAGLIGTYGAKFLKTAIEWIKSKVGTNTYNTAKEVAYGIYVYLEDKYNISGMGETKRKEMEALLLERFPSLTQAELDSINKEVWLSFNEEWYKKNSKSKPTEEPKRIDE